MKKIIMLSIFALLSLNAFSYGTDDPRSYGPKKSSNEKADIVDTAMATGYFKILAIALTKAGLIETLKGKGPFTLFAPSDEAFAKLPNETLDKLLEPENKSQLTQVLTYHVVPSKLMKENVKAGEIMTVQGTTFSVTTKGGTKLNGSANVIASDIKASNGVIHVIDSVIMPADLDL